MNDEQNQQNIPAPAPPENNQNIQPVNLRIPHSSAVGYLDKESLKTIGFQHKRFPLDTSQLAAG